MIEAEYCEINYTAATGRSEYANSAGFGPLDGLAMDYLRAAPLTVCDSFSAAPLLDGAFAEEIEVKPEVFTWLSFIFCRKNSDVFDFLASSLSPVARLQLCYGGGPETMFVCRSSYELERHVESLDFNNSSFNLTKRSSLYYRHGPKTVDEDLVFDGASDFVEYRKSLSTLRRLTVKNGILSASIQPECFSFDGLFYFRDSVLNKINRLSLGLTPISKISPTLKIKPGHSR